jgi:endopeptidase La
MNISVKKYKMYNLENEYNDISELLFLLQKHVYTLLKESILDINDKNNVTNKLSDIIKELNRSYNIIINNESNVNKLKTYKLDKNIQDLLPICNDNNLLYKKLLDLIQYNKIIKNLSVSNTDPIFNIHNYSPLHNIKIKLINYMEYVGFPNINKILELIICPLYYKIYSKQHITIINELNMIFKTISVKQFDKENEHRTIFFCNPTQRNKNDHLEKLIYVWVKHPFVPNKFIRLEGYFIDDNMNIIMRTSPLLHKRLYNKKKKIKELLKTKKYICHKFVENFLKYCMIKWYYVYSVVEYCDNLEKCYKRYQEIKEKTFMNIIKEFTSKNSTISSMFNIIFLQLLGSKDSEDIASLLFGIIKDRKIGTTYIPDLIYYQLPYRLQTKLKKISNDINEEIEKLKMLSPDEIDYKKQIIACKSMPNIVKSMSLEKIEEMKSQNNEYYKQLTYVKYLIQFPWPTENDDAFYKNLQNDNTKSKEYIVSVQHKLTALSYGHEETKKSLVQLIGKLISNPESSGTAFGFVGPPGVGKTLLAKSVSSALDIPFVQITLGGQNDGELLHGHGYTYSGSQPGMIVKKMVDAGKSRCIMYFDELDKACSKHGQINEITSILIHLTDPNMNNTFQDRFFQGIDFPLNKVIMIFSYNDSDLIDPILLDRIREIKVKPYNLKDKLQILEKFILPEMAQNIGFDKDLVKIKTKDMENIINNFTFEAGVRDLKRNIETLFLELNLDKIFQRNLFKNYQKGNIQLSFDCIKKILDKNEHKYTEIHKHPEIGIINGMYATTSGSGGIIPIQIFRNSTVSSNKFEFKLTGSQGNTMKESVMCSYTAAIEYIRRNLKKYNYTVSKFDKYMNETFVNGFHVHTPCTASPKDGPSAGCAFTSAFISIILGKPIKNTIAMTGEIELTGRITKIGGLPYKLAGAKRAGVKTVYICKENKEDYELILKENGELFTDGFSVHIVETIDDVIPLIL